MSGTLRPPMCSNHQCPLSLLRAFKTFGNFLVTTSFSLKERKHTKGKSVKKEFFFFPPQMRQNVLLAFHLVANIALIKVNLGLLGEHRIRHPVLIHTLDFNFCLVPSLHMLVFFSSVGVWFRVSQVYIICSFHPDYYKKKKKKNK